jgi:hypothetical protein
MLTISFLLYIYIVITNEWSSEADVLIKQKCQQNRFCFPIGRFIVQLFYSRGSLEGAIKMIDGTKTDFKGPVQMGRSYPGLRRKLFD